MLPETAELEISPSDLAAWRKALQRDQGSDGGATPTPTPPLNLIDCREADEFAFNRIDGASLMALSVFAEQAKALLPGGDAETPIVIYCHHGMRSMQATQFLRQRGLTKVWSLAGGIDAWSQEIDPAVPRY